MQDAKGMLIQEKYRQAAAAEELYKAVPTLIEISNADFWEKQGEGIMKYKGDLNKMPKLDWPLLYNL
eukprot:4148195-Alexandrium_andersonii.AAC.1